MTHLQKLEHFLKKKRRKMKQLQKSRVKNEKRSQKPNKDIIKK